MEQGGITLQTLFNVAVESVVFNWLSPMVEDEKFIQDRLGHAVVFFYAYDRILGSPDPEWLQGAQNVLIGLFWRIRLAENIAKSKTMTCHTGSI